MTIPYCEIRIEEKMHEYLCGKEYISIVVKLEHVSINISICLNIRRCKTYLFRIINCFKKKKVNSEFWISRRKSCFYDVDESAMHFNLWWLYWLVELGKEIADMLIDMLCSVGWGYPKKIENCLSKSKRDHWQFSSVAVKFVLVEKLCSLKISVFDGHILFLPIQNSDLSLFNVWRITREARTRIWSVKKKRKNKSWNSKRSATQQKSSDERKGRN